MPMRAKNSLLSFEDMQECAMAVATSTFAELVIA